MSSTENCTHVTPECPVVATLYGYRPNLAVDAFFAALFGSCLVVQLIIGTWKKTWSYMAWVSIGCFGEFLGYIGRLMMHSNPWNESGLEIQICCLVLAPSFLAAGIYLTLKHTTIYCGPEYSRIRPKLYPWIFVGCDLFSIFVQAIGGGVAAAAGSTGNLSLANTGDDLIMAGIAIQIFSMLFFFVFAIDYWQRIRKARRAVNEENKRAEDGAAKDGRRVTFFYYSMSFAFVTILIRCAYRIHEMAGGWGNPRMRDQVLFLCLDGTMVGLAAVAMTVAHPAIFFPPWQLKKASDVSGAT